MHTPYTIKTYTDIPIVIFTFLLRQRRDHYIYLFRHACQVWSLCKCGHGYINGLLLWVFSPVV